MSGFEDLETPALLEEALKLSRHDTKSEEREKCLSEIYRRGELAIFETAKDWSGSDEIIKRELAADILSQLGTFMENDGVESFTFTDQTIPLLERLLEDPEDRVIASAVHALEHHYGLDPILKTRPNLASHPSADVRYAVAHALCGTTSQLAINTLIQLSADKEDKVRDWATFGLGEQCHTGNGLMDSPEIRQALFARVNDNHSDTRSEALLGLAKRNDQRVVPFIKAELKAEMVSNLEVEAAGEIASSDLVEPLEAMLEFWDVDTELLHAAIKRCKGEANPDEDWRWDNHAPDEA